MKLLVGRLVLGCIFAVLAMAEEPITETAETTPELTTTTTMSTETPEPEKKAKIFAKPDPTSGNDQREVFILPDHSNGHHDEHHHHHHPTAPPHHHHPTAPPHHHHPPPHHHHPPPHHHHYPNYYSPYYPPQYPYGAPVYAPIPQPQPYPYYPPQYPPHSYVKPITVIQTESGSSSGNSQNFIKPAELLHQGTGYLWNLIDQKNTDLWNLFGNKQGGGGNNDDDLVHEVVVSYGKPGIGTTTGGQPSGGNWFFKGKNLAKTDCNTNK